MKKILWWALCALVLQGAAARAETFSEGVHYVELFQAQPVDTGDKIEVRELFWYGCPHCYDLEPILNRWLKRLPKDAAFVRMPAVLRPSWAVHARAYYAFEALGVTARLHGRLFDAIHRDGRHLDSMEALAEFAAENGVDKKQFIGAFQSFGVDAALRKAQILGRQYEADGVPTLIVDGRYRSTATMAGSHERLMQVVDFLIKKARAARRRGDG